VRERVCVREGYVLMSVFVCVCVCVCVCVRGRESMPSTLVDSFLKVSRLNKKWYVKIIALIFILFKLFYY